MHTKCKCNSTSKQQRNKNMFLLHTLVTLRKKSNRFGPRRHTKGSCLGVLNIPFCKKWHQGEHNQQRGEKEEERKMCTQTQNHLTVRTIERDFALAYVNLLGFCTGGMDFFPKRQMKARGVMRTEACNQTCALVIGQWVPEHDRVAARLGGEQSPHSWRPQALLKVLGRNAAGIPCAKVNDEFNEIFWCQRCANHHGDLQNIVVIIPTT